MSFFFEEERRRRRREDEKKKNQSIIDIPSFTCLVVGRDRKLAGDGARGRGAAAASASSLGCRSVGGGARVEEEGEASPPSSMASNAMVAEE